MGRADNTRFLAQAAADRHQATLKKASDAIAHLHSSGQPVNFSSVAAAAGISRTSLYRHPDIRDLISRMRSAPSPSATTPPAQRATAESLRARLDTARTEITRLRAENTTLRDQAARHLGEQRATPAPTRRHQPGHAQNLTSATCPRRTTPHLPGHQQNRLKIRLKSRRGTRTSRRRERRAEWDDLCAEPSSWDAPRGRSSHLSLPTRETRARMGEVRGSSPRRPTQVRPLASAFTVSTDPDRQQYSTATVMLHRARSVFSVRRKRSFIWAAWTNTSFPAT